MKEDRTPKSKEEKSDLLICINCCILKYSRKKTTISNGYNEFGIQ